MCDSVFKMFALFILCASYTTSLSVVQSFKDVFLIFKLVTEFRVCIVDFSVRKYNN